MVSVNEFRKKEPKKVWMPKDVEYSAEGIEPFKELSVYYLILESTGDERYWQFFSN